ncbi:MAG: VWA domain-containing protein [Anaerolineae bacterium]|nr:VWA domain-containing protein [Anaerolineae bacterium]
MDQRIIDFIAGLRAAGVRVSIAESEDAFKATGCIGILNKNEFQASLRATLVKEANDRPIFDQLFPLYFGSGGPPLLNLMDDLSPEEKQLLAQALRALLEQMRQNEQRRDMQQRQRGGSASAQNQLNNLMQLLQWLLQGQNPNPEMLDRLGRQAGVPRADHPFQQRWLEQRIQRQLGMQLLEQLLAQLPELLKQLGMSQKAIDQLVEGMEANREALAEQIAQQVGAAIARQRAESHRQQKQDGVDLMHRPFKNLSEREAQLLRDQVRRLAAQLRSRAALRQKRGKSGVLDVKRTFRSNLIYGGVPLELKFKTRRLKPKLLLICDVSTSMRAVVEFLLRLIYELQDQVASAHSFAFIDDLEDISQNFAEYPADVAIEVVLTRLQPGHYNTDLGNSLNTLMQRYAGAIDHRTTVIFVGDARNNYNNPRLDLMEQIKRRSKRIIWLNPEHPRQWGAGDSDMPAYLPYTHAIHRVSTLAELTVAVDKLLTTP